MRYLITGGSGYIGGRITDELSSRDETEKIVDVDLRPPPRSWPKHEFVKADIRDRKQMRELLERHEIDALLHFAFVLNPIRDEARMYDIDVNGTQAVLEAASDAGVKQVIQTSSATAYGAFPDNPKPIAEDWPVRGAPDFSYAKHKADSDRIAQLWALENPDAVMTIVRPSHRLRPKRRQLHRPRLLQQPVRARSSTGSTRSSSSSTRTTSSPRWSRCSTASTRAPSTSPATAC